MRQVLGDIIKTATLGTQRSQPVSDPFLKNEILEIEKNAVDKEDAFIKSCSLIFAFDEAGNDGTIIENTLPVCPEETQNIATGKLASHCKRAIYEKNYALLNYLLFVLNKRNRVVPKFLVAPLMTLSQSRFLDGALVLQVCGATGKWIQSLNPEWSDIVNASNNDDVWEVGSPAERKKYFLDLRKNRPAACKEILENDFESENAEIRLHMVSAMEEGLSLEDEEFLSRCANDRSAKVKRAAFQLLSMLPNSDLGKEYIRYIENAVHLEESRVLIVRTKRAIKIREKIAPSDVIIQSGLDQTSNLKEVPDDVFRVGQILGYVDPKTVSKNLGLDEETAIALFAKHPNINYLGPFLADAACRFKNLVWAKALIENNLIVASPSLIELFGLKERREWMLKFALSMDFNILLNMYFDDHYTEFEKPFAQMILEYLVEEQYAINDLTYRQLAFYIPQSLRSALNAYEKGLAMTPKKYFSDRCKFMIEILDCKKEIEST